MERDIILEKVREADMVLVGLGEDFNGRKQLKDCPGYLSGCRSLEEAGYRWLFPAWLDYCFHKWNADRVAGALEKLADFLKDKNYFVVADSVNSAIAVTPWKPGRLVMPCGSSLWKQCEHGCDSVLEETVDRDREALGEIFGELYKGNFSLDRMPELGSCPQCGGRMIFNSVYAKAYNENGYMEAWKLYTKWLQGTLNRKLLILELGVGMDFPTVMRWPFEKAAFFNQKAYFCRVHENLYQLTEELAGKGCGISQNAIDWLEFL